MIGAGFLGAERASFAVRRSASRSGLRPDRRASSCMYAAVKAGRRPALLAVVMRGI